MPTQVSAKLSKKEFEEIRKLVRSGLYINISDFVREAVRKSMAELKEVSMDAPEIVEKRVYDYLKSKGVSVWPDEAARELGYSVLEVLNALERLKKKGKPIRSKIFPRLIECADKT